MNKELIMPVQMRLDLIDYTIEIFFPKALENNIPEIRNQLDEAFKIYQNNFNSDANWYYFANSIKADPKLLAYNKEGLTELVLKKLTFGFKRVGQDGDLILSFIDIDKDPAIEGQLLFYLASRYLNSPFLKSEIKFLFTHKKAGVYNKITQFFTELAKVFSDCYIEINLKDTFPKQNALFPQRIGTSMIVYIPSPLNADDYPEAHRMIPINRDDKQVGTVIISLDHIPNRDNIEDIKIINRLDIRLREADLLPTRQ